MMELASFKKSGVVLYFIVAASFSHDAFAGSDPNDARLSFVGFGVANDVASPSVQFEETGGTWDFDSTGYSKWQFGSLKNLSVSNDESFLFPFYFQLGMTLRNVEDFDDIHEKYRYSLYNLGTGFTVSNIVGVYAGVGAYAGWGEVGSERSKIDNKDTTKNHGANFNFGTVVRPLPQIDHGFSIDYDTGPETLVISYVYCGW